MYFIFVCAYVLVRANIFLGFQKSVSWEEVHRFFSDIDVLFSTMFKIVVVCFFNLFDFSPFYLDLVTRNDQSRQYCNTEQFRSEQILTLLKYSITVPFS